MALWRIALMAWAVQAEIYNFRRWQHEGLERIYILFAPEENRSLPLWLLCPGTNVDATSMLGITDALSLARKHLVALAVLQGHDLALNVHFQAQALPGRPDDVSYTRAVIADASSRLAVDDQRIYCIGSSRGARFCSRLASELPISGLLVNAGLRFPRPNNLTRPLPIVTMHDLRDDVNPYGGGGASYWQESVEDTMQAWSNFNNCSQSLRQSVPDTPWGSTWVQRHIQCDSDVEVWLLVSNNGRHAWPGNRFAEIGLEFLQRQQMRGESSYSGDWPNWPLYPEYSGCRLAAALLGFMSWAVA